jgi:hypothetical protein
MRSQMPATIRCGLSALPLLLLGACAGAQTIGLHAAQAEVPPIAVFEQTPADAVDLGEVSDTTCLNNFFDPRPGWEIALNGLKIAAARKGANSMSGVTYQESNRFFCATGLKLTARAIVATPSSLEEAKRPAVSQKCETASDLSDFMACKIQALPRG